MRNNWDSIYTESADAGQAWKDHPDLYLMSRITPHLDSRSAVLDMGCGDGRNMAHLLRLGFGVTGLDMSEAALTRAREFAERLGIAERLTLIRGDVHATGLDDECYDFAYSTQVLDHVEDPRQVISEAHRITRNNGRFIAQLSTTKDDALMLGKYVGRHEREYLGFRFRFFDRSEIDSMFSQWQLLSVDSVKIEDPPHPGWRDESHEHSYWLVEARKVTGLAD